MKNKPDFYQIPRQDLRTYVLSHREDDEALRIYIDRMRTEPGITRFNGTTSEEDFKKLEELIQSPSTKEKIPQPSANQTKYDLSNAQIGGIIDTAQANSNPKIHQHNYPAQNLAEAAQQIQQLLDRLSQTYPSQTTTEQMTIATQAIAEIERNTTWKQNAIAAFKQGLLEALKTNTIGAFVVGAIAGWQQ